MLKFVQNNQSYQHYPACVLCECAQAVHLVIVLGDVDSGRGPWASLQLLGYPRNGLYPEIIEI